LALLAGLAVFFLRKRRKDKRAGRRGSRPVQHRDIFEIDGHPADGDPTLNPHVTPYDPYHDSASTPGEQSYVTEVLGSSQGTAPLGVDNLSPNSSLGPSDSSSQYGSRRNRTSSNISSARCLAPLPEQDAGPLLLLNESDDEGELRAVAGPSLPPVYSSIIGVPPQSAALRDEKPVVRGGLRVVGSRSDEDS
jgi:hypothetical protein